MKLDILLVSLNFSLGLAAYETGMSIGSRFQDLDPILAPIRSASYNPSNSRVQFAAPWYLDRIDQRDAILDHTFISDVRASPALAPFNCHLCSISLQVL